MTDVFKTCRSIFNSYAAKAAICTARRASIVSGATVLATYGHSGFPGAVAESGAITVGGAVKYRHLNAIFPHAGRVFNILYAVSSSHTPQMLALARRAKCQGIPFVWNQNGTYFPLAYPSNVVEQGNRQMAELLHLADRVLYQSEFCRFAADHFLGSRTQGAEILYNAVNMSAFKPPASRPAAFTLAICGSHHDPYRLPLAVQTLAVVRRTIRDARLYIAGRASSDQLREVCGLASTAGVADAVDISGPYRQEDAPSVYGAAHVLLHTKYADPCPSVVIEAMGCGLPIVYSKTGGTPELVGEEAGYGVPGELDWYTPRPPSAEDMAEGVCVVAERLKSYSSAARERAVEKFDLKPWLERHRQVFEMLARSS